MFAVEPPEIIITASRIAEDAADTPASVTVIDQQRIDRLGAPLVGDLLRLVPSVAVSQSGPAGSLTQVRIRGAEATHTLLFIDGIRANDPAAANEPRFELLNADLASRIEVVRGPQSALWGSEAIGGVVSVEGPAPGSGGTQALAEVGSFSTRRAAARTSIGDEATGASLGIAAQRSGGIDSFSGDGDRDGYRNLAFRGSSQARLSQDLTIGASGFMLRGRSQYDGYDASFRHADTLDETRNRLSAGRLFVEAGDRETRFVTLSASLLGSANRNLLAEALLNRTSGSRRTVELEAGHRFGRQRFVAAIESERELFHARDFGFGAANQDRSRTHQSLALEWHGNFKLIQAGLAIRHDIFSRFKDATTLRASMLGNLGAGFQLSATYGEGIAQPSFFDLFGYFPNSFSGNPALRPERSKGGELSLRYRSRRFDAALTAYGQRLSDEIIDLFDPATLRSSAANADGVSRRRGVEAELNWRWSPALSLSAHYAWLAANEPAVSGGMLKEQRRPRPSGGVSVDGRRGRFSYGAAIAYSGARVDTDFEAFPSRRVTLAPYWLASARLAYRVTRRIEAHVRVANAFDADYQDVLGYRTEGRSIHAGLGLALGD